MTVINADGTLRWSRQVQDDSDPIDNSASGDVDAAIDQYGRVVVTFTSSLPTVADPNVSHRYIQARLFDKNGAPLGPRFVVSEYENPSNPDAAYDSDSPRVAWRGNKVAFCWRGGDAPTVIAEGYQSYQVLASRFFAAPLMLTSASHSGTTTTLAWTGGVPPYSIQRKSPLTGSWSTVKSGISGTSTTYTDSATAAYYRVQSSN